MTYHIALVSSSRDIDAASVESIDKGNGVRIRYGVRHGSQTREAFAYELDGSVFAEGAARAYMQGRGIDVVEFRAAKAEDEPKYFEIECEVARVGKWRPNVFDGKGEPVEDAEVEFTAEMFAQMVETFGGDAPFKLGHYDQAGAREMFAEGDRPMGTIHKLRVDGDALVATAKVPASVKDAIGAKLLLQRSIEATKRAGKWFLDAVAWLKNSPPAVQGMPDAQVSASIFASARLVLADAAHSPGGPETKHGEDSEPKGTPPAGAIEPDPAEGKETTDMSEELKAQMSAILTELRVSACQRVDDLVGKKITPAQGEQLKVQIQATEDPKVINSFVAFAAAGADIAPLNTGKGSILPAKDTANPLDERAEVEKRIAASEKSSAHRIELNDHEARIMAAAKQYMTDHPKSDFGDALNAVSRHMPDDVSAYMAATGRGRG